MYRLYDYLPCGNGYKVRLALKQLHLPYELIEVDPLAGATRTTGFLAKNINARVPVLEIPGIGFLPESHAILAYLAEGSALIPQQRFARARMWQWLCFEQSSLEPSIAPLRRWLTLMGRPRGELGEQLLVGKKAGYAALDVLEDALCERRFLAGDDYSLADLALFAHVHLAPEAEFDLAPYPNIRGWCARVMAQPDWAPITES